MENVKDKVKEFIGNALVEAGHDQLVDENTSLIVGGLLESLMVVHLVVFIESEFHIDFSEVYFDQYMFDTIDNITKFIEEKR